MAQKLLTQHEEMYMYVGSCDLVDRFKKNSCAKKYSAFINTCIMYRCCPQNANALRFVSFTI
jgi:hypothetical protein